MTRQLRTQLTNAFDSARDESGASSVLNLFFTITLAMFA